MVAASYAPELAVIGVAAFAPATDLGALGAGISDTLFGRIVLAYLAATWTGIDPRVAGLVAPGAASLVPRIAALCFGGRDLVAAAALSSQMFGPVFRAEAFDGPPGERLRAMSPAGAIGAPVLIAQGGADQLVLPERQRAFVAARCAAGQAIDYREYPGKAHLPLVAADSPLTAELVAWTAARLAGALAVSTCGSPAEGEAAPPAAASLR
jgi:alpha-beta hydrolase superfamily lysophospholipase